MREIYIHLWCHWKNSNPMELELDMVMSHVQCLCLHCLLFIHRKIFRIFDLFVLRVNHLTVDGLLCECAKCCCWEMPNSKMCVIRDVKWDSQLVCIVSLCKHFRLLSVPHIKRELPAWWHIFLIFLSQSLSHSLSLSSCERASACVPKVYLKINHAISIESTVW